MLVDTQKHAKPRMRDSKRKESAVSEVTWEASVASEWSEDWEDVSSLARKAQAQPNDAKRNGTRKSPNETTRHMGGRRKRREAGTKMAERRRTLRDPKQHEIAKIVDANRKG